MACIRGRCMPFNRVISAGIIAFAVTACGSSSSTSTQTDPSGEGSGTLPDDRDSAKLGCGWVLQSDPTILNVAFPDASATYWVAVVPNVPGTRLRIDGQYPDARYFSFNAYDPALRPIDGIADARIAPDAGSGNPFSDEGATSGRHYSLTVEFGKKPEVPAQNTLYSGSIMVNGALALPNPVTVLLYRIYIPASGLPLNADVPLPALTLETAAGDVLVPSRAGCSEPVLGTVVNQLAQVDLNGADRKSTRLNSSH